MKEKLDLIEGRLQSLIEGTISLFLPWNNQRRSLAHELVEAMRAHLSFQPDGRIIAPSRYVLFFNPEANKSWQVDTSALNELARALEQAAHETGFLFSTPPTLQFVKDSLLKRDELRIETAFTASGLGETTTLALPPKAPTSLEDRDIRTLHAFLIVNSENHYYLGPAVINIGRRKDNHLVIDDIRVSRVHAQIRPVKGRYILFDLNSKGGTFINGRRIMQQTLNPGDVISLAGVPLIYGEDDSAQSANSTGLTQRTPLDPHLDTSLKRRTP